MLRTPDSRFADLPGWPYPPQYAHPLGADGPRMAYVDVGPRAAPVTALCLHGNPAWGYLYRHMLPMFTAAGLRVVVPDLIGFGRSDKPEDAGWHQFDTHRQSLLTFIDQLDLRNVMLVCQDWGGIFGLTLPMAAPQRFARLLVMNTTLATGETSDGFKAWRDYSNSQPDLAVGKLLKRGKRELPDAEAAGYDAPFPDASYKAALRAFPNLVPEGRGRAGRRHQPRRPGLLAARLAGPELHGRRCVGPCAGPADHGGLARPHPRLPAADGGGRRRPLRAGVGRSDRHCRTDAFRPVCCLS